MAGGWAQRGGRLQCDQRKWALAFRSQINDFLYCKGNGDQPQTWPFVRKVVLEGPWPVLNTGACLVDLPGVRDANVAQCCPCLRGQIIFAAL